ncbi:MAG: hypothetical protein K2J61_02160, partial [Clostridia bacterium]|nr:hypothetical protein [Clostridia bacterium]
MLYILTPIFCVALLCGTVFSFSKTDAYAYTSKNMPTGNNVVSNIFDSDKGKFSRVELDRIAKKAGFTGVDAMITAATGGTTKTAANFGNTVVEFGTYKNAGLKWIPSYLSKDSEGNAILTLWLASTDKTNSGTSNQEVSTWTDGTVYDKWNMGDDGNRVETQVTQQFNGHTVFSDSYDGSYIRNYILNGGNDYTKNWGQEKPITPPAKSTLTKFTQFTSGALSSYIVTPSKVGWQMAESIAKNDPAFVGGAYSIPDNYPIDWTNDKIWLPSIYEVGDTVMAVYGTTSAFGTTDELDGGLWKTDDSMKDFDTDEVWLRTTDERFRDSFYVLNHQNSTKKIRIRVWSTDDQVAAVRPALHLNLTKALENAVIYAPKNINNLTYDGNAKWLPQLTGSEKPDWYDSEVYTGSTYMSVKSTEYTDTRNNPAEQVAVTSVRNAGTYKVTMSLKSGYKWDDGTTGDKSFNIKIAKADPNVVAGFVDSNVSKGIYTSYNNGELPALKNAATNPTPGTIEWQSGQSPSTTDTTYYWQFTPDEANINNYNIITGRSEATAITVPYKTQTVKRLEIVLNEGAQFYDAFTLTDGDYS